MYVCVFLCTAVIPFIPTVPLPKYTQTTNNASWYIALSYLKFYALSLKASIKILSSTATKK